MYLIPINMLKKVHLIIDYNRFMNCEYPEESSCIKHQVDELTDIHQQYGGFPDSYSLENTKIKQRWWNESEIDFKDIGSQLSMDVITVSSILQPPGNVIPWHRDTFYQIKQRYPNREDTMGRANIYLEDWKMGQLIQFQEEVDTHWKSGEGWLWDSSILHLGANAGMQSKYTLQVSGFLI